MAIKKPKKRDIKKWIVEHKTILIIIVAIVILLALFGTKIYLYLNLLLGNDIILRIEASDEELNLIRGENATVEFKVKVLTNPFCKAECSSVFEDLGKNKIIDRYQFEVLRINPKSREYGISINEFGEGQNLYRYSVECTSKKTFLCHTEQETTSRSMLVSAIYRLSEEETELKEMLSIELNEFAGNLSEMQEQDIILNRKISAVKNIIQIDDVSKSTIESEKLIVTTERLMQEAKQVWSSENYDLLEQKTDAINMLIISAKEKLNDSESRMDTLYEEYNYLVDSLVEARNKINSLLDKNYINNTEKDLLEKVARDFNSAFEKMSKKSSMLERKISVERAVSSIDEIERTIQDRLERDAMEMHISTDISYELLCITTGDCVSRPNINQRAYQDIEISQACEEQVKLQAFYNKINENMEDLNDSSLANATLALEGLKDKIKKEMILALPESSPNGDLIKSIIIVKNKTMQNAENDAITYLEISSEVKKCVKNNLTDIEINNQILNKITFDLTNISTQKIEFEEPSPKCCYLGKCDACCTKGECNENIPVIFLHGHAMNKATAAEYSLDAFNKMQKQLETDGYLNVGAISLYTPFPEEKNVWGLVRAPVSIKVSYYFDIFQDPHDYVIVQTKSENIDTYSLRLKDLIERVQAKTGKNKVNIIAHSMGGLVARRYIQIFGTEKVNKLIMIGTPNKGIRGSTAKYCSLFGEEMECRDMDSQSLFMNKLNRETIPAIDIYNIIGVGCMMNGEDSDGVIYANDVFLEGAKNFYINGTCESLTKLHTEILNTDKHPETYGLVIDALTE